MADAETFAVQLRETFPVGAAQLYAAWTERNILTQWWGPTGFTCPIADMDVRVGAVSVVAMRAPAEFGGGDILNSWTYTRVEPGSRLEFESRFVDADRRPISPADIGIPGSVPAVVPHTLTFEVDDQGSRLSVREDGYPDAATRDMSSAGMQQCLDKLRGLLAGDPTLGGAPPEGA